MENYHMNSPPLAIQTVGTLIRANKCIEDGEIIDTMEQKELLLNEINIINKATVAQKVSLFKMDIGEEFEFVKLEALETAKLTKIIRNRVQKLMATIHSHLPISSEPSICTNAKLQQLICLLDQINSVLDSIRIPKTSKHSALTYRDPSHPSIRLHPYKISSSAQLSPLTSLHLPIKQESNSQTNTIPLNSTHSLKTSKYSAPIRMTPQSSLHQTVPTQTITHSTPLPSLMSLCIPIKQEPNSETMIVSLNSSPTPKTSKYTAHTHVVSQSSLHQTTPSQTITHSTTPPSLMSLSIPMKEQCNQSTSTQTTIHHTALPSLMSLHIPMKELPIPKP